MRQDFSTTYENSIGSIFQPWEPGYYIRALREQNAIKIFRLCHRKITFCIFSLCALLVKSCPNSINIGTTWKKNLRSFHLLPILDRMQSAKKPSHANVPLSRAVLSYKSLILKSQRVFSSSYAADVANSSLDFPAESEEFSLWGTVYL